MAVYSIVLYLHIVGALGLFVALGLEFVTVSRLRSAATAEQAREWLGVLRPLRVLGPLALAAILLPGLYMVATRAGWQPWNALALLAMVVIAALGAASNATRMPAIGRSIGPLRGPLPPEARARLRDPMVWSSVQIRIGIALGIVLLMTAKPDAIAAFIILIAFAIAGAVVAFATTGARPGPEAANALERAS